MDRQSSPTNHIGAAAASRQGIAAFDPLAFNAGPRNGGGHAPTSSTGGFGYDASDATTPRGENPPPGRYAPNGGAHMDVDGGDADGADGATQRNKGRPRTVQNLEEIPPVTDETGERVREGFRDFLQRFVDDVDEAGEGGEEPKYIEYIYALRDYGHTTLYVDFTHLLRHDEILARAISDQYYR